MQPESPDKLDAPQLGIFTSIKKMISEVNSQNILSVAPYPTRYIEILKALVESDVGPKPARQK